MNDIQVANATPAAPANSRQWLSSPTTLAAQTSLLPEPQSLTGDDALTGLLAVEARHRNLNLNRAIQNINTVRKEQSAEWAKQKAALLEASRAQEKSGFWSSLGKVCGTIGKVAAVVTSIAVAAGTGGAGLPFVLGVAGACLSGAALAQGEFGILQKLRVDAETSSWIELGLALGGVACTAGAAWVGGAESVTRFQKIASAAERITATAGGGVTIAAGVATVERYKAEAEAQDCFADAESARVNEMRLDQILISILDDLEESEESHRDTVSRARGAMEIEDNTLLVAIRRN